MSPGATFERVYGAIKQMLLEGELPPGTPIEPAVIGREIAASITPVRDALHRLTGERLVDPRLDRTLRFLRHVDIQRLIEPHQLKTLTN